MTRLTALLFALLIPLAGAPAAEPSEPSDFDFVDVAATVPGVRVEPPYATEANFLGRKIYPSNRCFLRRRTAAKLALAQAALARQGYGLKVLDGYRPPAAQRLMWATRPARGYVANPAKGSRHQRGAAVDVTLVAADGRALEMPTEFDDFSPRAAADFPGATAAARRHRSILQQAMIAAGFVGLAAEWWHFDDRDWRRYPLADVSAETLEASAPTSEAARSPTFPAR